MIKKKSIRLYLDEPKDRVVYDRIRSIGESKRMSENRFMIDAIYQYIKLTDKEAYIKEIIQNTIRDEFRSVFGSIFTAPAERQIQNPQPAENTDEENKAVLAFINGL